LETGEIIEFENRILTVANPEEKVNVVAKLWIPHRIGTFILFDDSVGE